MLNISITPETVVRYLSYSGKDSYGTIKTWVSLLKLAFERQTDLDERLLEGKKAINVLYIAFIEEKPAEEIDTLRLKAIEAFSKHMK